ncbi:MAG: 3-deoxy-7-phosphoheptulonate synthase/chorismate mutase [Planctomycetota bacterium]|jgi:3-deoxy-7-phosphoheptulonate synthase/chorismate mutase
MITDPELNRLREQMDDVNQRLLNVLQERARLSRRIGSHKQNEDLIVVDPVREQAMLKTLLHDLPTDGFPGSALTTILQSVFAASRELVASPKD